MYFIFECYLLYEDSMILFFYSHIAYPVLKGIMRNTSAKIIMSSPDRLYNDYFSMNNERLRTYLSP